MADVVRKIEFGTYLSVIFFWKVQGEKIGVAFLGEITYKLYSCYPITVNYAKGD